MAKKTLYFIFLCCLVLSAKAQSYTSQNKKAIRLFERALTSLEQGNTGNAESLAGEAAKEDDSFLEAHLLVAELALDMGKEQTALVHYRKVVDGNATFHTQAWMELAKIELKNNNFDQAMADYRHFLKYDTKHRDIHAEAEKGIVSAQFRKEALANPVPFTPVNMGSSINSRDDEYLPALTADGQTLVFTRRFPRKASTVADTREEEDIYCSILTDGKWCNATRMPEPLNSNDNEGAECISQDGRIMFFTACNRQDGGGRCDIYMCIKHGDTWGKPRNLGPKVNSGAWEGQPTFSIDGKTLYFVSNRKGGFGGMDIWKTVFEDGHWTEPVNLGPTVNTEGNEMSPFIHNDDKTLYFASDGHIGMGGMDIFVTRRSDNGDWQKPRNLGWPINTAGDESNLIVSADARTAIYSSDRGGGLGKLDLWQFDMPEQARPTMATCFKGVVTNATNGARVAADIKVVDLASGQVVANTSSDSKSGEYIVSLPSGKDYAFLVSAKDFLFHSRNCTWDEGSQWQTITVDIALQPIVAGSRIALRNVFFETAKWDLLPESEYELGKVVEMLRQNPSLKIALEGHTDNVGQAAANQKLSEQRAKAVHDYLISKGIDQGRLSYKGYGATHPVASNDNEEGRALNRRTELVVK